MEENKIIQEAEIYAEQLEAKQHKKFLIVENSSQLHGLNQKFERVRESRLERVR